MFSPHHVAVSVKDLEESINFYQKLGFTIKYRWDAEDNSLSILHLWLKSLFLELFCYQDSHPIPAFTQDINKDLPTLGIKHFALSVESLEKAYEDLKCKNIQSTEIKEGRTGIRYFFIRDPNGIMIEVVEDKRELNHE